MRLLSRRRWCSTIRSDLPASPEAISAYSTASCRQAFGSCNTRITVAMASLIAGRSGSGEDRGAQRRLARSAGSADAIVLGAQYELKNSEGRLGGYTVFVARSLRECAIDNVALTAVVSGCKCAALSPTADSQVMPPSKLSG